MRRRHLLAHRVAGCLLVGLLAALPAPATATPVAGHTFSWVGSSINHDADNHSWTDPRNWSPEGVPGDGDAVNIVSPQTLPCDVNVDLVPQGVELSNLLLSTSTTTGCHASLSGGSIAVLSTMVWTGGTLDTPVVMSPGSGLLIGDEPVHVIERLRKPLTVRGGGLTLASAHIRIQDGGGIELDRAAATSVTISTDVRDVRTQGGRPGIVDRGSLDLFATLSLDAVEMRQGGPVDLHEGARVVARGSTLALPAGAHIHGVGGEPRPVVKVVNSTVFVPPSMGDPVAVIDDVAIRAVDSTFDVSPGAELDVVGGHRGTLSGSLLSGGGTMAVAAPMNALGEFSLEGGSVLRLQPGGSLDGSCVYTGTGSFEWLGGALSGNDVAFGLDDVTVGGATTKTIDDDHGFTSFVQVVNPVTFTPGTRATPNLLDMNGNSFQSFVAETLQRNVEIRDGAFVSSGGALVIDPGPGGVVRTDVDAQLFSSGPLTVASGRLDSQGELLVNDGSAEVTAGAALRLPEAGHPLVLNGGSLSGGGTIDGDIVNSGGVFEPARAGASGPMTLHGSYRQTSGGRLILDLSADSAPVAFDGSVTVSGIVAYQNAAGYRPGFGDERTPLSAGEALTWTPSCEETTGSRAGQGHWRGEADQRSVLATFEKGASGTCELRSKPGEQVPHLGHPQRRPHEVVFTPTGVTHVHQAAGWPHRGRPMSSGRGSGHYSEARHRQEST